MEFTCDRPFIRDILEQERAWARDEIRHLGVLCALESSQQRHDARIAAAPDVGTLACRAGYTWCCYFTVDVRAAEVFRILDFIEQSFTTEEKVRVYAEVRASAIGSTNSPMRIGVPSPPCPRVVSEFSACGKCSYLSYISHIIA